MLKQELKTKLIKNSFWSFFSALISRAGALIFTIVLARFLLPEGYGLYSLVLSVAMIFLTFSDLGVNNALVRYISSSLAKDKKRIAAYHNYLLKIKLFLALLTSILLLILSYPLAFWIFKNSVLFVPFLLTSLYILVLSFETFYFSVFYSIERVEFVSFHEILNQVLRIIFILLVFYLTASSYHLIGVFLALILNSFLLIIFSVYYLNKLIPELFMKPKEKINKRRVIKFVSFLVIAAISAVFFSYIDSIMLGIFLKPEYVGYYKVAFSVVLGVIGFISSPIAILLPVLTKVNKPLSKKIINKVLDLFIVLTIPASFGLAFLGKYFLRLFFGYSFLPSYLPLYFLSFLILPSTCVGILSALFAAKEKPQIVARLVVISSILNIILNLIFIKTFLLISPLWATAGAGIATLLSWIFYFLAFIFYSKKELAISFNFKTLAKSFFSSFIMLIVLYYLGSYFVDINLLNGILLVTSGILTYFVSIFLIKGIKYKDLKLFKSLFKTF